MSDRLSLDLFHLMFPGDLSRNIPAAADTAAGVTLQTYFANLDDVDALLREGSALEAERDPNVILKALKAQAPDLIDRFIQQGVIAYFSDPTVVRTLTGKPTPLFPNHNQLPDIDYDLLEPVLANRGEYAND